MGFQCLRQMQILRPERTGTQDDSVAMVNRNDLRVEFLQSVAKALALRIFLNMHRAKFFA